VFSQGCIVVKSWPSDNFCAIVAVMNWNELNLSDELLELITKANYSEPTPVQAQAIPLALSGQDVLVSSQTGSGKTAAFVLPMVEKFKGRNGTYILALSPTREIAQQTGAVFETFGAPLGLKTAVCIGGVSIPLEKEALAASPHIIVATPGRLCDHLERGNVWLDFIQCLIFDEADRMLDMGFANQINTITDHLPKERQTLMFSATFAPNVEKLARNVMKEPKQVNIERTQESKPQIEEMLYWLSEDKKINRLVSILREEKGSVFVFARSKERVYQVWRLLHSRKIEDATYIHSDLAQEQREEAIANFKSGKFRIIVATDVAARGIDVDDVAHVVNYDVPREAEDYIHRIGRTGRRGRSGHASTFAIPGKDDLAVKAIAKLKGSEAPPPPSLSQEVRPQRDSRPRSSHKQDTGFQRNPRSQNEARPEKGQRPPRHRQVSENKNTPSVQVQNIPVPQKKSLLQKVIGWFRG